MFLLFTHFVLTMCQILDKDLGREERAVMLNKNTILVLKNVKLETEVTRGMNKMLKVLSEG